MGFFNKNTTEPTTETTPTPAVEQNPTPQTEPTQPAPVQEPKTEPKKTETNHGNNSFFSHLNRPRENQINNTADDLDDVFGEEEEEPTPQTDKTTEQPETKKEVPTERKLSPAACKSGGEFIADIKDLAFPKLISYLAKHPDKWEQYRADPDSKQAIADAWARWLQEKNTEVSPGWQIVIATVMGYGIPLGMIGFERILKYFDERKEKQEAAAQNSENAYLRQQIAEMQQHQQNKAAGENTQQQQQQQQQQQPTAPETIIEPTPEPTPEPKFKPGDQIKPCIECGTMFKEGQGYPANPKSKYFDTTCNKTCLGKHTAKKSKGNRKNKK